MLCVYDPATHDHHFDSVADHAADDPRPARRAPDAPTPPHTLLVIETCDVAGWVHDLAAALGMTVAVANPAHEAWRWTRVKRKTDKDDALKLAKLAVLGQLPTAHMPSPQQRQRRRLVHYRRVLVDRRTQIKNQVRSIFSQQGLQLPPRGKAWTKIGLAQIAARSATAGASATSIDDLWRGRLHVELQLLEPLTGRSSRWTPSSTRWAPRTTRVQLLQTVPGVGPRLAETVVAHLDDPHRFKTAGQVASYAGLVPKQFESGTIKRCCRITRRGPALLRSMLVEVAWMVYLRNDWAKQFVAAHQPRRGVAQEHRDRRAGPQAAGDAVGDAARRHALARAGGDRPPPARGARRDRRDRRRSGRERTDERTNRQDIDACNAYGPTSANPMRSVRTRSSE